MFIVFEGIDGCGKGTQADRAVGHLRDTFGRCTSIKYPDRSTPVGKLVNEWLGGRLRVHDCHGGAMGEASESVNALFGQALILANKIEVQHALQTSLRIGHVVADRYAPSAVAYGHADGLDLKWLTDSHAGLLQPDLYVLLDIPVEVSFQRRPKRQEVYETNIGRLEKARKIYLHQAKHSPQRWCVIDGTLSQDAIFQKVIDALDRLYAETV